MDTLFGNQMLGSSNWYHSDQPTFTVPTRNYESLVAAMGQTFFQTAQYGWRSVAAWHFGGMSLVWKGLLNKSPIPSAWWFNHHFVYFSSNNWDDVFCFCKHIFQNKTTFPPVESSTNLVRFKITNGGLAAV